MGTKKTGKGRRKIGRKKRACGPRFVTANSPFRFCQPSAVLGAAPGRDLRHAGLNAALPPVGNGHRRAALCGKQAALPDLIVVRWIDPLPRESLPAYARRLAAVIDPGTPCLVGGCSFGGMVATEMCWHLDARACLLISSIRSPGELPYYFALTHCALLATQLLRLVPLASRTTLPITRHVLPCGSSRRLSNWPAIRAVFCNGPPGRYSPGSRVRHQAPVVAIHGTRDRILPCRNVHADEYVEGGGHLLPLTHPEEVNRFLHSQLERFDDSTGEVA